MSDDYDYLTMDSSDKNVLKNLSKMGEQLKTLKLRMLEAQANADAAKKEYEHYANVVLPTEMFSAGVDSLSLTSGGNITVKRNFYCQPNKNAKDRATMAAWLRENGGEYLIKSNAKVSMDDMDSLKDNNIPFIEETDINTNSLKSFLKDKIGATTGVQQIKVEDIPDCIHFQEVTSVDLTLPRN